MLLDDLIIKIEVDEVELMVDIPETTVVLEADPFAIVEISKSSGPYGLIIEANQIEVQIEDQPEFTFVADSSPDVIVIAAGNIGNPGPPGAPGSVGPIGPQGPAGPAGPPAASYIFIQGPPSAIWVVTHNLNRQPSVTVVDTGDSVIIPSVHYDSANQVTLTFGSATSGKAYLN